MSWSVDNDLHVFFYSEYDEENYCHNNKWTIQVNCSPSPQITIESPYDMEFKIKNNSFHVGYFARGWDSFEIPMPVLLALAEASKILKEEEEKEEKRKQEYNEFLRSCEESFKKKSIKTLS
jgi:hypothetical protein